MQSSKKTLFILSLIVLILLAIFAWGIFEIRNKNGETSALASKIEESQSREIMTQSANILRAAYKEELEMLELLKLSEDEIVGFIEELERVGREQGVLIEVTNVNVSAADGPKKIKMSLDAKGSWAGILGFVHALESLPQRVMIESSRLEKRGALWHSSTNLSLYLFD